MTRSAQTNVAADEQSLQRIDLNLLNIFDVVMVERHVTRAAERLSMTQSAVSNSLNRLRKSVGDQLFVKAARGVDPTPRALELWPQIHQSILALNGSVRPHRFNPGETRQRFRISVVDLMASLLAPQLYKDFCRAAPHSAIHFVPHNEELAPGYLMRSEINLAIGVQPPRQSVLQAIPLWSEPYLIAARRGHPILARAPTLSEFCAAPQVLVNMTGSEEFETTVDSALANRGMKRNIKLSVNQFSVAATVLLESDLIAVMPARFASTAYARGQVGVRPLPIAIANAVLYLTWHRRNNAQPSHEWLKDLVMEATGALKSEVERVVPRKLLIKIA